VRVDVVRRHASSRWLRADAAPSSAADAKADVHAYIAADPSADVAADEALW